MTLIIPQGKSLLFYNGSSEVDLTPYAGFINQVIEIHNNGEWIKLYNPSLLEFSDFTTMTPSLSYEFFAYQEFTITV